MNIILESDPFRSWLANLKDRPGRFAIIARLRRAGIGNFGDCKNLGSGLFEMRVDVGPGYRIYYERTGENKYAVLLGGNKSHQQADINLARCMLAERRNQA